MDNTELQHWGVKGMKWGVRRYQNKDGTLTAAGKKRYAQELEKLKKEEQVLKNRKRTQAQIDKLEAKRKKLAEEKKALDEAANPTKAKKPASENSDKPKPKAKRSIKDLSDDELAAVVRRIELEKRYQSLVSDGKSKEDVSRGKQFMEKVGKEVLTPAAIGLGKKLLDKGVDKMFKDKPDPNSTSALKKKFERLDLEKKIRDLENEKRKSNN